MSTDIKSNELQMEGGSLFNLDETDALSSEKLEECLKLNRQLQDNLTLRLASIEQAKFINSKYQRRINQLVASNGLFNEDKSSEFQGEKEKEKVKVKYRSSMPPLLTGNQNEDTKIKEISSFEYFPYFLVGQDKVPSDNLDTLKKSRVPPLIKNTKKWTLTERSLLAAGVRQENIRLKIEEILKKAYGNKIDNTPGKITKPNYDPSKEIWEVRNLPDHTLELNLNDLNWEKISTHVAGRTPKDCAIRWTCYDHPLINKAEWTTEEEASLVKIAKAHKFRNWPLIAAELNTNRTAIQCFHQYQSKLCHQVSRKRWTKEEDNILREAVRVYGERNWQQIAQCLENRTGQQCLHRWAKALNPAIKRGRWTPEEDEVLKAAVAKFGAQSWVKIQPYVKGRTDVQCRERWMNVLHPNINDSFWNPYEDALLLTLVNKIGVGKWSSISQEISNRTDNQCWRRWKRLVNIGVVDSTLIDDVVALSAFKENMQKQNAGKRHSHRDEDDSGHSDGDARYRSSTIPKSRVKIQKNKVPSEATASELTSELNVLPKEANNVLSNEELLKKPIGGGTSYRREGIEHSWAPIDQRIAVHLDMGKPLPPVMGSLNLYERLLEEAEITDDLFYSETEGTSKVLSTDFKANDKDLQKLKDIFQSLFAFPHICGTLSVRNNENVTDSSSNLEHFNDLVSSNTTGQNQNTFTNEQMAELLKHALSSNIQSHFDQLNSSQQSEFNLSPNVKEDEDGLDIGEDEYKEKD